MASSLADEYFSKGNGSRAHTLAAIGNCHIDSAWLWPYTETKRKVARSFSSQLALMDRYPEHIFVASQVQMFGIKYNNNCVHIFCDMPKIVPCIHF